MNKIFLQFWELSQKDKNPIPDGCSIHLDENHHNQYINSIYEKRKNKSVPESYERIIGPLTEAFIEDDLYKKIKLEKNLRLMQSDLNNLVNFDELTIKEI